MEKVVFLCAALFFLWMSVFHGTDAQSRYTELCQYNGGVENATTFPAKLHESINVTLCVSSPHYYPLQDAARLISPGNSRDDWIHPTKSEGGSSRRMLTFTISKLQEIDFTDMFAIKVYYTNTKGEVAFDDALVFTFSLFKDKIYLCRERDGAKNGTSFPAKIHGSVNVTLCVRSPYYETLHDYAHLIRPGSSRNIWIRPRIMEFESRYSYPPTYLCTFTISDLQPIEFTETFIIKVYYSMYDGFPALNDALVFMFSLYEVPAEISAFHLTQGDTTQGISEITNTDLIITHLQTIEVKESDNFLTFSCNATGSSYLHVSINHNNITMSQSRDGYVTYVVEKATCKDSGSYSCQATNEFGESELISSKIQVLCPVGITSFTIYKAGTVPGNFLQTPPNDSVSFLCEAEGNLTPNAMYIQNERNGVMLSSTYSQDSVTYFISHAQCPHMGAYYCKVETRRQSDNRLQEKVELAVHACPVQLCNPSDSSTRMSSSLGETVSIPLCLVSYHYTPELTNTVEKNNTLVYYNSGKYMLEATMLPDSKIYWNATLWIYNVDLEQEDFGTVIFGIDNYAIRVSLTYTVYLKPEGLPSCPSNINMTNQGTSYVTLSWQPGFDGGADQSFHVFHSMDNATWTHSDVRGSANTYTLNGLTANTTYAIRVVASNKFTDPRNINEELCDSTVYHTTVRPATDQDNNGDNSCHDITTLFVILGVLAFHVVTMAVLGL